MQHHHIVKLDFEQTANVEIYEKEHEDSDSDTKGCSSSDDPKAFSDSSDEK